MASTKPSRSRALSGTPAKGNAKETGPKLEENLNVFKSDNFDADGFVQSKCHSLNEKEIRQLRSYLLDLKRASAEEMRRSVYANYTAFIRTSKEISDLEGELSSIRNLLSTQATLIHGLSEGVHIDSSSVTVPDGSTSNGLSNDEVRDPSDLEKWLIEFPDILDVLLAERRVEEALATLDEGERVASEAKEMKTLSPAVLMSLQTAITDCRTKLANQLADAACHPSTRGIELRAAISALKRLGDGPRAHNLLLKAHYQRFQSNMQNLRPSSTSYGGAYTAAISQLDFFEDVGPLLSMQLGGKTLEGLFQVFSSYVNILIRALPGSMEEEANFEGYGNKIVRMAETEAQQMALLANASLLADELLPRAAMKLAPLSQGNYKDDPRRRPSDRQNRHPEQREWKRRLASSVDRLKDSFCRQHALDLIFTEDGDSHLSADMYINMDGNVDQVEWFPSLIFQELYAKLYRMSAIAAEMFVGRERFATMLLMRLTETVILWLSEDQSFWDDIEEGPRPLGPLGLQQFYLDMKFVICFATQGRYLSRNLHRVVNEIISKAVEAFASTGMDPYSVLPEDEWFNDICQDAIERLSGRPKVANGDRDLNSPTASVSAQSISSVRSHGSS